MSLQRFIQNIPLDKKEHLVLGVIYSILIPLGGLILGDFGAISGLVIGLFLVLWKEIWHDWRNKKGNPEVLDFVYNVVPIIITFISYMM